MTTDANDPKRQWLIRHVPPSAADQRVLAIFVRILLRVWGIDASSDDRVVRKAALFTVLGQARSCNAIQRVLLSFFLCLVTTDVT